MADLRNCQECGRLFAYQGRNLCRKCLEKEEEEYLIVRRYVREHPGATVFEVAEATDIEEEKILQFLRDGRLQSRGFTNVIECERCGAKISSGRYCQSCTNSLASDLNKAAFSTQKRKEELEPKHRTGERMFVKDSEKYK